MDVNLIGFSGKMTSGKTTLANIFVEQYGIERMAIGDEIKRVSNLLIEDKEGLKHFLSGKRSYDKLQENYNRLAEEISDFEFIKEGSIYRKNKAYRYLTQQTGDILRNEMGSDIWVKVFLEQVNKKINQGIKVVCDDIRLKSEYYLLQDSGFEVVRLHVEEEKQKERILKLYGSFSPEALKHKTETDLDDVEFERFVDTTKDSVRESYNNVLQLL